MPLMNRSVRVCEGRIDEGCFVNISGFVTGDFVVVYEKMV